MTAQQPVNQQDFALVEQFLDAMWMERGLSENTLASYRNDLMKLLTWMEHHRYRLDFISLSGLQEYQTYLVDLDYKQTSRARMLSAIRRLFQYLHREKVRADDPSACWSARNCHNAYRKTSAKSKWTHFWTRQIRMIR